MIWGSIGGRPTCFDWLLQVHLRLTSSRCQRSRGIGFEDQDQLLQLDFWELDDRSELPNQSQQHQLFSAGDVWSTFLMAPQDEDLLTKQQ